MSATERRDALGNTLGFRQNSTTGTWSGSCPTCGAPEAQVWSGGLSCPSCRPLTLEEAEARYGNAGGERPSRKLPAPMGIAALRRIEEPAEEWLVTGLVLASADMLLAAYPKSYKTMLLLELAVALTTGTPFLGRFRVPARRRVGLVLMEDQAYRVRRRLERMLGARGLSLEDVDGRLFLWFRPPLRLNDATVGELGDFAADLDLDFLGVDSWAYVAKGDSNSADDVTPQLQALSEARTKRPGLTVELTHHARKEQGDGAGKRLTDVVRNSSAFGAWYDVGIALSRKDEMSPVTVRVELRDHPAPDAFAFTVEDEHPAGPHNDFKPSGWLRLLATDRRPELVEREADAQRLAPAVLDVVRAHPGCSKAQLRRDVSADHHAIEAAFALLCDQGRARYVEPEKRGKAGACYATDDGTTVDHGSTSVEPRLGDLGYPASPPVGGDGHRTPALSTDENGQPRSHDPTHDLLEAAP